MTESRTTEGQESPYGGGVLYVVATPIGNLQDISKRAVDVLSNVALIAAEDTRRSLALLDALGLSKPQMLSLHDHNEAQATEQVLSALKQGRTVALVSDAGTPVLSDPGFALVRNCYTAGIPVHPVPGPSSIVAALSVCPIPTDGVRFVGFLPARGAARRSRLKELLGLGYPVVFFEAPHRLRDCLVDLGELDMSRRIFVAREMTKKFETYLCDVSAALIERMDEARQWRGEVVCVLEGAASLGADEKEAARVMGILAGELSPSQAARIGASLLEMKRSELYEMVRQLKAGEEG